MARSTLSSRLRASLGTAKQTAPSPPPAPVTSSPTSPATAAPVVPVTFVGVPARAAYDAAIVAHIEANFKRKSQDTALISARKHREVLEYLRDPLTTKYSTSNERLRLRTYYRGNKVHTGADVDHVLMSNRQNKDKTVYKPVAQQEQLFDLISEHHLDGRHHLGRDKTFAGVSGAWSEVPKWAVELYIKLCFECKDSKARGSVSKAPAVRSKKAVSRSTRASTSVVVTPTYTPRRMKRTLNNSEGEDSASRNGGKRAKVAPPSPPSSAPDDFSRYCPSTPTSVGSYAALSHFGGLGMTTPLKRKRVLDDEADIVMSSPLKRNRTAGYATPPFRSYSPLPTPDSPHTSPRPAQYDTLDWPVFFELAGPVDLSTSSVSSASSAVTSFTDSPQNRSQMDLYLASLDSPIHLHAAWSYGTAAASANCSDAMSRSSSSDSTSSFWSTLSASTAATDDPGYESSAGSDDMLAATARSSRLPTKRRRDEDEDAVVPKRICGSPPPPHSTVFGFASPPPTPSQSLPQGPSPASRSSFAAACLRLLDEPSPTRTFVNTSAPSPPYAIAPHLTWVSPSKQASSASSFLAALSADRTPAMKW